MDYTQIIKGFDIEGLKLSKVTNKFVKDNFDISEAMRTSEVEVIVKDVDFRKFYMGNSMPISLYQGMIMKHLEAEEVTHVKTIRPHPQSQPILVLTKFEKETVPEKDFVNGIKDALKEAIKVSNSKEEPKED